MNPALSRLASIQPSDTAGARAKNRFDYQRDWILCRMLELYEAGNDFIVVCDYHDDVLVLDANPACSSVDFFQVKTDVADRFTINRLLARRKLKGKRVSHSILGKLYAHRFNFAGAVGSTTLVTNGHPRLTAAGPPSIEDRIRWTVIDLASNEQDRIRDKLTDELASLGTVTLDGSLAFEASPLPVAGHATFALGLITEFLHRLDGHGEHPVMALYRAVVDEIDRRAGREGAFATSSEILEHKCITRPLFEVVLRRCLELSRRGMASRVEKHVQDNLIGADYGVKRTRAVCRAVRRLAIQRINPDNLRLARLSERARAFLSDPAEPDYKTLAEAMDAGVDALRSLSESQGAGDEDLMAIVAWEMIDDREPTPTPPQHEDEAK